MKQVAAIFGLAVGLASILTWQFAARDWTAPDWAAPDRAAREQELGAPAPREAQIPPSRSQTDAAARADGDALNAIAAAILERPLFSPDRRPSAQPPATAAASAVSDNDMFPRLTGVIVGPREKRAIFTGGDGKGGDARSRAIAEGDTIGGFRVRSIDPGAVTLSGADGDHVLRPTYLAPQGPPR